MTKSNRFLACPRCGTNLPQNAKFCLNCGNSAHRLDYPATVHQIQRHPLGLEPPQLLGGLSAMAAALAVLLFAAGAAIAGVLLMLVAVALGALLLAAVRRQPHAPTARVIVRASDRAAALTRVTAVALRRWGRSAGGLLDRRPQTVDR